MNRLRGTLGYVLATAVPAILVGVIGGLVVSDQAREAVWTGVGIAFAVQVVMFVSLFVIALGSRPLMAHLLGMAGRFAAVVVVALFWAPWSNLPAAPLLLPLVAVFFLTTLLEPLFMNRPAQVR